MYYFPSHINGTIYEWNNFIASLLAIVLSSYAGSRIGVLRHQNAPHPHRRIISNIVVSFSIMSVYGYFLFTLRNIIPGFVVLTLFAIIAFVVGVFL